MPNTNKAEEIFSKHWYKVTDTKLDDMILHKMRYCIDAMEEYRQSEIDELTNDKNQLEMDLFSIRMESSHEIAELTKEVERLSKLSKDLFSLWESLAEIGEIHIGEGFSSKFNNFKEEIKK